MKQTTTQVGDIMGRKILLVVDGSVETSRAVEDVRSRPWPTGTKVTVLAVAPSYRLPPPPPPMQLVLSGHRRRPRDESARARVWVQLAVEELRSCGLSAEGKVRLGRLYREIYDETCESPVDLIVMDSSMLSPWRRLLLGRRFTKSTMGNDPRSVEVFAPKQPATEVERAS